jgi:hypothetical protein
MPWSFRCPNPQCGHTVAVDRLFAGGRCPCPDCGTLITVSLAFLRENGIQPAPGTEVIRKRPLPFHREKQQMLKEKKRKTEIAIREMHQIMPPKEKKEEEKKRSEGSGSDAV